MRCLIIGQGIAGAVLAWTLRRRGADVQVADADFPHRSSSIAAGIINPVTGKRYVKTWRYDDFFPVAQSVYQTMQTEWGVPIWQDQTILRLLETPQAVNDWSVRLADANYAGLLSERKDSGPWADLLAPGLFPGEIRGAARVDFGALLRGFRTEAQSAGIFLPKPISPETAVLMSRDYDCIIFCEGYRGAENPLFPKLPWQLSKGEAMLLRLRHPNARLVREMVKKTLLLAPLQDGLFWAGASYNWTFEDNGPTDAEQFFLEARLMEFLRAPYEVVQRMGAIRPTVKDRRPFLGASPEYPQVFIFNGMGTKGALLAPYWAAHLADHLLHGTSMEKAVDIQRVSGL